MHGQGEGVGEGEGGIGAVQGGVIGIRANGRRQSTKEQHELSSRPLPSASVDLGTWPIPDVAVDLR